MQTEEHLTEQPEWSSPLAAPPPIQNRFLFVDVAALRAKQLRRGALPRLTPPSPDPVTGHRPEMPRKPERLAMEEVRTGLVEYEVPGARKLGDSAA